MDVSRIRKLAIGIPSRGYASPLWEENLNEIIAEAKKLFEVKVIREVSKYRNVAQQRNVILEKVLREDFDYFFFLDDDVFPPKDVIEKLTDENQHIICGVYWSKVDIDYNSVYGYKCDLKTIKLNEEQINNVGFGCCLMDRVALNKVRELEKPIVPKFYKPKEDSIIAGEDAAFYHRIGMDVYLAGNVLCDHYEHTKNRFFPSDWTCHQLTRQRRFYKNLPYEKSTKKRGIYFMTDDNWIEYAVAFLNSLRRVMPDIDLCLIPATKKMDKLIALKDKYNFKILETDLEKYDKLSLEFDKKIDPTYRKFAIWEKESPFEEFIYLSADSVVLHDLSFLLEGLRDYDFVCDYLFGQCWDKEILKTGLVSKKQFNYQPDFCQFASRGGLITWKMIQDNLPTLKKLQEYVLIKQKPTIKQSTFIYLVNFSNCTFLKVPTSYGAERDKAEIRGDKLFDGTREIFVLNWRALSYKDLKFEKDNKYKPIWEHFRNLKKNKWQLDLSALFYERR